MLLIALIAFSYIAIHQVSGTCESNETVQPDTTELGQNVTLVCHLNACRQSQYNYYRFNNNQISEQPILVHHGRHRYTFKVTDYDDAALYYCTEECSEEIDQEEDRRCWFSITTPTEITWDLPKAATLYEEIHGSITITGSPVPSGDLIFIEYCEHQYTVTTIDPYTVRVNFTIHNATELCQIYCYPTSNPETRRLNITIVNMTYTSITESTTTFTPNPTRTVDQSSSTHSLTNATPSHNIQPTTTTSTTEISQVHNANTGGGDGNANTNTGMIIALLLLMVTVFIVTMINLMFAIRNWRRQESKC